ncbi:hypothetical protein LCGC14_1765910 [marine sediment metagenome]|uniref:Uncharacterized protein n=1 Tax=marine sediment metagenome TaxID=412755 RepID=A0A0F9JEN7_9ZZZZ
MKIDHLCHINFTWAEVRSALADQIEYYANSEIVGSPKNLQLKELANKARSGDSYIEYTDVNHDGVILCVDGVAFTEELGEDNGQD